MRVLTFELTINRNSRCHYLHGKWRRG